MVTKTTDHIVENVTEKKKLLIGAAVLKLLANIERAKEQHGKSIPKNREDSMNNLKTLVNDRGFRTRRRNVFFSCAKRMRKMDS
jgi:hypothetical protein